LGINGDLNRWTWSELLCQEEANSQNKQMRFKYLTIALLAMALSIPLSLQAELKIASIFGDNMVLQQKMRVPVWGWTTPDEPVTVTFAGQTRSTHADANGRWLVKLRSMKACTKPQTLTIQSGDSKIFTNVLVGEVWLASGQSNMEKPLGLQRGQKPCFNYEQELAAANYPQIRIFQVEKVMSATQLMDLDKFHSWQECSSNYLNSISFSAAAYYFGRDLFTNLDVPVGLIESSWGGTRIEPWTPPAGFESVPSLAHLADDPIPPGKAALTSPTMLYNAMIAPLAGYAMRGVIWYQGESNLMDGTNNYDYLNYDNKMLAMVNGWRALWHEGTFPFYFVQIAPFKYYGGAIQRVPSPQSLPEFWAIQSRARHRIKHSGMVVTTDLVNNLNDIHPRDKMDVGYRLALLALDKTYDRDIDSAGPVYRKSEIDGSKVVLKFKHVEGGLISKDGQPLTWFTIAGADGKFVPAEARIVDDTVEVSAPEIQKPVAVRFAWDETAQPNLFNQAGLPAEPFRTDQPGK
jgi:sialate O-acetylesterase